MPTVVYYDLLNQPGPGFPWRTVLIILFALALGALLYAYTVVSEDGTYKDQKFMIMVLLVGVCCLEISAQWSKTHQDNECRSWRNKGLYQISEGKIGHFREDPSQSHKWESFDLKGQTFTYPFGNGHYPRCGFDQTKYWGGPLHEGKWVRIYHNEGLILRLELAQ